MVWGSCRVLGFGVYIGFGVWGSCRVFGFGVHVGLGLI